MDVVVARQMIRHLCSTLWGLLCAYWILCSAAVFIALHEWTSLELFRSAVKLSAARGKTWNIRDRRLKRIAVRMILDWSVPQVYFWHFYAIGCIATISVGIHCAEPFLLIFFGFHVLRRLLETCVLMKYPPKAQMHLFAYLYGLSYYVVVPTSLAFPQFCPSGEMGYVGHSFNSYTITRLASTLGGLIFLLGTAIQLHSHYILATLQRKSEKGAYSLPTGGMFEYVSCPHYLGEILIYVGLSFIGQGHHLLLLMNIWVLLNLMLGSRDTHQWYHRHFETYPIKRYALIPFLY